jgi:acetylornithine/N-succinyldiaminopimelate aminotransferase
LDSAQQLASEHHFDLYKRYPITLTQGRGARVTDTDGNEYIDALAGIAVNSVGHCHPNVVEAIQDQADNLIHISNLYYNQPQSELAELLTEVSGMDRVFFCNSGAEAVEGAIKMARKHGNHEDKQGDIISMHNCFHGRTIGTIAMGKDKYSKSFRPMPSGFSKVSMNNVEELEETMDDDTLAVILEPIQGEGGIHPVEKAYLEKVRELCDQHNAVMILDEIQCGVGRTGKMYAWQHYGVQPDIVTSAKALGGVFPIGAVLATDKASELFEHGDHGTTYGGNPLACAAAKASIQTIIEEDLLDQAIEKGNYFMNKMRSVAQNWEAITEVRGAGLMIGVELNFKGAKVVEHMMHEGILSNCASDNVMRLVPPLTISMDDLKKVAQVLIDSIKKVEEEHNG